MKIVFLARRFYPDIGGVEKHVLEISNRLIKLGHTVTVITQSQNEKKTKETVGGISVVRIPTIPKEKNDKFFIWQWMWKERDLIQEADVIHCHDVFYWYLPFRFLYPTNQFLLPFMDMKVFRLKHEQNL